MGRHTAVNRTSVQRASEPFNANRKTVRGNASTRAKKAAVTRSVASMKPLDFMHKSPKSIQKSIAATGSPMMPRAKAKAQQRQVMSQGVVGVGLTKSVRRGTKKTFTGKKIRWW